MELLQLLKFKRRDIPPWSYRDCEAEMLGIINNMPAEPMECVLRFMYGQQHIETLIIRALAYDKISDYVQTKYGPRPISGEELLSYAESKKIDADAVKRYFEHFAVAKPTITTLKVELGQKRAYELAESWKQFIDFSDEGTICVEWVWIGITDGAWQHQKYIPCDINPKYANCVTLEQLSVAKEAKNFITRSPTESYFDINHETGIFYRDQQDCAVWAQDAEGQIYQYYPKTASYYKAIVAKSLPEFLTHMDIENATWYRANGHRLPQSLRP